MRDFQGDTMPAGHSPADAMSPLQAEAYALQQSGTQNSLSQAALATIGRHLPLLLLLTGCDSPGTDNDTSTTGSDSDTDTADTATPYSEPESPNGSLPSTFYGIPQTEQPTLATDSNSNESTSNQSVSNESVTNELVTNESVTEAAHSAESKFLDLKEAAPADANVLSAQLNAVTKKDFDGMDADSDGYLTKSELDNAEKDPKVTEAKAQLVKSLKKSFDDIEQASNDEWGTEDSGITPADMAAAKDQSFAPRIETPVEIPSPADKPVDSPKPTIQQFYPEIVWKTQSQPQDQKSDSDIQQSVVSCPLNCHY